MTILKQIISFLRNLLSKTGKTAKSKNVIYLFVFVIGIFAGYSFRKPVVTETVRKEVVVKWKTKEVIKTLPGATVFIKPGGKIEIVGPVEIARDSEGSREEKAETIQQVTNPPWHVALGASLVLPQTSYRFMGAARIGHLAIFNVGVQGGVITDRHFLPKRFEAGILLTF